MFCFALSKLTPCILFLSNFLPSTTFSSYATVLLSIIYLLRYVLYKLLINSATHEVTLTSGDLLFYESSKCFHGRPRPFNGSWYSSVFVHYYPTNGYKDTFDKLAKVNRIPPHWSKEPTTQYEIPLAMHGTTMEEPL